MKHLSIFILILFLSLHVSSQETCTDLSFITKYNKKECYYTKKIKRLIKKTLIRDYPYNFLSVSPFLNDVEYLSIPMLKISLNDTVVYTNKCDFFNSLELHDEFLFSEVMMFKNDKFFGNYSCDELGADGVILENYSSNCCVNLLNALNEINTIGYDNIFYIHGILHAWWIVKDTDISVYSFLDKTFYKPQDFLDKFYTNEQIIKIIQYFQ